MKNDYLNNENENQSAKHQNEQNDDVFDIDTPIKLTAISPMLEGAPSDYNECMRLYDEYVKKENHYRR